jgi:hypothetical protein
MHHLLRPRIWPSFLTSSGVGPCDVPFRYVSASILDFGFRISDFWLQEMISNGTVQISPCAFSLSKTFTQVFNPRSAIRIPQSSARWHAHLPGLATVIREISGISLLIIFGETPVQGRTSRYLWVLLSHSLGSSEGSRRNCGLFPPIYPLFSWKESWITKTFSPSPGRSTIVPFLGPKSFPAERCQQC